MHRILLSAFIAFAVLAAIFLPRQAPEDALAESVFLRACQQDFGPRVRLTGKQLEQLCHCAAPHVLKAMGSIPFLQGKPDKPWGLQAEAQLRDAVQTCVAPMANASGKK